MTTLEDLAIGGSWNELRRRIEAGEGERSDWVVLSLVLSEGAGTELANLLIDHEVGLEWGDVVGRFKPPLHLAAIRGNVEITKRLIDAGVPLHCTGSGSVAFQWATRSQADSAQEVMRILYAAGGLHDRNDFTDRSWFMTLECAGPNLPVLAELLGSATVVASHGLTLLHFAVAARCGGAVKGLVDAGADITAKTTEKSVVNGIKVRSGATPLKLAVQMRKKFASWHNPEMEALLTDERPAKRSRRPKKKKKVRLIRVFKAPDWGAEKRAHLHPGARLLLHPDRQGLFCAYCGAPYLATEPQPVGEVANEDIDVRKMMMLSPATHWDQFEGIRQSAVKSLKARVNKFAKRAADLAPGTMWRTTTVSARGGLEAFPENEWGEVGDEPNGTAALFREMLAWTTNGGDELDLLREAAVSEDLRARSALALLHMKYPRMPAWFWNPAMAVPDHLIEDCESMLAGVVSNRLEPLWTIERSKKNLEILVAIMEGSKSNLALLASRSLPTDKHPLWDHITPDERQRVDSAVRSVKARGASG